MNKAIISILLCSITSVGLFTSYDYNGSTTAAVILAGGIVSAQHVNIDQKYKRKDCPVCKGKGWYMSGDGISKVPCGYCEPDDQKSEVAHPPVVMQPECKTKVYKK